MHPPAGVEVVRVTLDVSGSIAFCACSDGTLLTYALPVSTPGGALPVGPGRAMGQLLARAPGHAEMMTSVLLMDGHQGVVTVGGDGCVMQWALPKGLTAKLAAREEEAVAAAAAEAAALMQAEAGGGAGGRGQSAGDGKGGKDDTPDGKKAVPLCWQDPAARAILSSTLLRLKHGMPLQSTDKLPRWAAQRAPVGAAAFEVPAEGSDHDADSVGAAGHGEQAGGSGAQGRWATGSQRGAAKVEAAAAATAAGAATETQSDTLSHRCGGCDV